VLGNDQADKLTGAALVKEKLQYDKKDVIKALWDKIRNGQIRWRIYLYLG